MEKIIGIHQINYFPWLGYFNKMAKSDLFVYLDEVQLTKGSVMERTSVITSAGKKSYLTVGINSKGHLGKKYSEIEINNEIDWQLRQKNFIFGNYTKHPFFDEIISAIRPIFETKYHFLKEVSLESINIVRDILGITTPVVMQSMLNSLGEKDALVLSLVKEVDGTVYLSGNGARKYMKEDMFVNDGVKVCYQVFSPFPYPQRKVQDFVPGLSVLDILFNLGIEGARKAFWENIQKEEECFGGEV